MKFKWLKRLFGFNVQPTIDTTQNIDPISDTSDVDPDNGSYSYAIGETRGKQAIPLVDNTNKQYYGYSIRTGGDSNTINSAPAIEPINGKIVMIGLGASLPKTVFDEFIRKSIGIPNNVKIINCCIPARDINRWNDVHDKTWWQVHDILESEGVSLDEVQIIWNMHDDLRAGSKNFPADALTLRDKFKTLVGIYKNEFPNLKQIHWSGRPYSGFSTKAKHDEPKGYHNGWTCRFLIEDNLENPSDLSIWMNDTCYLWSREDRPRLSDGFHLVRNDFKNDGIHLTPSGDSKVADLLVNYFNQFDFYNKNI